MVDLQGKNVSGTGTSACRAHGILCNGIQGLYRNTWNTGKVQYYTGNGEYCTGNMECYIGNMKYCKGMWSNVKGMSSQSVPAAD